ncbi:BnaA04g16140D [Brassica napus]|uniref:(rape) hypothetical protein n=1 Tax=Brassica napus TaxID=3708 RepID=A0A078GZI3_BRANA|nr:unnamed protein product [Brassica napus]CDY30519.1 BnaA04g16140D [Brassica napus]
MNQNSELKALEKLSSNAKQIQEDMLEEILRSSANTEYLRRFLHGSSDKELFKKNVPVVTYEDVKPYMERVANGEPSNVISGEPITQFFISSGTSGGKQKIYALNNKHIKGVEDGKREEVVSIFVPFACSLIDAIKFLETHWKELCNDIRSGHVSEWITDLGCRDSVSNILGVPNAELADKIERECCQTSWEVTGQMSQCIPILEFYSSKLPLVSLNYSASETLFGVNVNPLCKPQDVSYTCVPNTSYFEFLPVDEGNNAQVVDLVDVKLGHLYDPVVTGFYNKTPQFRFVRRKDTVISVHIEKTTEEDIVNAVNRVTTVLESAGLMLMGFTCKSDMSTFPGHYVFYWEFKAKKIDCIVKLDNNVMVKCCCVMEESFNALYRRHRRKYGTIGPLEIRVMQQGTFDSLMEYFISQGAFAHQYKTPLCKV